MSTPTITLNGKTYKPVNPKVKLWREIVKFKQTKNISDEKALDEMEKLVIAAFNHPEVTQEAIEEYLDLGNFLPLFGKISEWVADIVMGKISELPNE